MANYLPVFLVSVGTNAIPDDSSLITLPRGQVDYLSHDWREEDVWRSWRNMTRQKNEIANGIRLENASWRTWWKQRNKLKTVTPETLNWLKDSDVTWLYGPLHTAAEWNPAPKPKPNPAIVGRANSAHDLLDLTITKKPILKHRSISELLTSDLPSPLFSPAESEVEDIDLSTVRVEQDNFGALEMRMNEEHQRHMWSQRPMLLHTKSDTHITRWSSNCADRAASPLQVIATKQGEGSQLRSQLFVNGRLHPPALQLPSYSNSSIYSYSPFDDTSNSISPALSDDHKNGGPSDSDVTPTPSAGLPSAGKRKHISFNTFVEQCIAIEKPKKSSSSARGWRGAIGGFDPDDSYDEGYEEDEEDGYGDEGLPLWPEQDNASNSDSDGQGDEEDDDVLEMHTSSYMSRFKPRTNGRSLSKTSSSSSSSSSSSGFRPPLIRLPSSDKEHVTIAPIAPTILKTTGVGNGHGWMDGFGDDASDEGFIGGGWYAGQAGKGGSGNSNGRSVSMPVELVYVPLGSNYGVKRGEGEGEGEEDAYFHKEAYFNTGADGLARAVRVVPSLGVTPASPPSVKVYGERGRVAEMPGSITTSPGVGRRVDADAYDCLGGPDIGGDFMTMPRSDGRSGGCVTHHEDAVQSGSGIVGGLADVTEGMQGLLVNDVDERPRSRPGSRSRSRTPSPTAFPPSSTSVCAPSSPSVAVPGRGRDLSPSPSALLSPPLRGRSSLPSPTREGRGRSSTRTSSSVSRERSSHGSPLGSLSPDGSAVGLGVGMKNVYAGGRVERGRDRGRRISESLSPRLSPDDVGADDTVAGTGMGQRRTIPDGGRCASSSSSTVSSSPTVMPTARTEPMEAPAIPSQRDISTPIENGEVGKRSRFSTSDMSILDVNPSHTPKLASPTTSYPASVLELPSHSPSNPTTKGRLSVDNPEHEGGTIVGRAVGIVSSAGAYLGFWQSAQGGASS